MEQHFMQRLLRRAKSRIHSPKNMPAIRITEYNGGIYSLDNRRLEAFQRAGVDIPYKKVDYSSLSDFEKSKFQTTNNGTSVRIRTGGGGL